MSLWLHLLLPLSAIASSIDALYNNLMNNLIVIYILGVETPVNQTNAHDMLIKELTIVNEKIIELYDLVDNDRQNGGSAQNPLVKEKVKALQETYRSFHADTLIHLGEEETYWPQCVENYGEVR